MRFFRTGCALIVLLLGVVACQQEDIFGEASMALSSLRATTSGASCSTCSSLPSSSSQGTASSRPSSQAVSQTSAQSTGASTASQASAQQSSATSGSAGPIVLRHTPEANATGQPITGVAITIDFDAAVDQTSLNPSSVKLSVGGIQQTVTMGSSIVYDPLLKIYVCRLTISGYILPREAACTLSLSPAIKTTDGRTLVGGYSFVFYTVPPPTITSFLPAQNTTLAPVSYVTLTASENIYYSGATVTVGGTAMSASTTLNSSDLSVTGNVLKIRMPDACFAWSDAGSGSLKTVQVSVSGVTAALDGAILPDTVLDYNLERAWQDVGAFDAAPPITGGSTARTVQLAATATHLYLAYSSGASFVGLRKYDLMSNGWVELVNSWPNLNQVFALTTSETKVYLVREHGEQIYINDFENTAYPAHTPVSGVSPTSLEAVTTGTDLWYLYNVCNANNYLRTYRVNLLGTTHDIQREHAPPYNMHSSPSLALKGSSPWMMYVDTTDTRYWDILGNQQYNNASSFEPEKPFKYLCVGSQEVVAGVFAASSLLTACQGWPPATTTVFTRTPISHQFDACVMDGTTPVFMYPMGPIGTSSLVCDGWYGGMSDMRPLATQRPDVSAHRADWSVVATGVALGARPAIVATTGAVFAAWYDSSQNKVFVRRHDGR